MNNNIQEDYCSFEVAKLLKEKGFDIYCQSLYHDNSGNWSDNIGNWNCLDNEEDGPHSSRPTHALAIKWIQQNFNIHIHSDFDGNMKWYYIITSYNNKNFGEGKSSASVYNLPEEATEAALLFTLKNLIP